MRLFLRSCLFLAFIILATSLTFPSLFRGQYPHPPGPIFDKNTARSYLNEIERQQPALVLLGDSMLTKGVDREDFEQIVGEPTYKLDIPGSSSALWYMILETNILRAQPGPHTVVVLFRDTLLTAPTFRTTGVYFGLIDRFASQEDTLLIERAYLSQLTPVQALMEQYLPLYTYRAEIRESVDGVLRHTLPRFAGCERACADDSLTGVLGDIQPELNRRAILQAEQLLYTRQQLDFDAQLPKSFLPEMIRLAKQRGIQLVFVRAPTDIFPNPASRPEGLDDYVLRLSSYLDEQDVLLLDLSQVYGIGPTQFVDPHHLSVEGKAIFTRVLAEALKSHIE